MNDFWFYFRTGTDFPFFNQLFDVKNFAYFFSLSSVEWKIPTDENNMRIFFQN